MSLRSIQKHIQSCGNIKKITATMKLVSAAKLAQAERLLRNVRPFGVATLSFYEHYTRVGQLDRVEEDLLVFAVASDRGLCGGVHAAVAKRVKAELSAPEQRRAKVVCVGQKARDLLTAAHGSSVLFTVLRVGKADPTFLDASSVFDECAHVDYAACRIFYNSSVTRGTSRVDRMSLYHTDLLMTVARIAGLDDVEEDTLRSYIEFSTVSLLFFAMVENAVCEHAARMIAMDGASKNVTKLSDKLALEYNRKRQSQITSDLIDIVSGSQVITGN